MALLRSCTAYAPKRPPLHHQVDDILQRLSKQRTSVPNAMAAAIRQQLETLRPSTLPVEQMEASAISNLAAETMAAAAGTQAGPDAGVQEALRLQQMLGDALNKLPALRYGCRFVLCWKLMLGCREAPDHRIGSSSHDTSQSCLRACHCRLQPGTTLVNALTTLC